MKKYIYLFLVILICITFMNRTHATQFHEEIDIPPIAGMETEEDLIHTCSLDDEHFDYPTFSQLNLLSYEEDEEYRLLYDEIYNGIFNLKDEIILSQTSKTQTDIYDIVSDIGDDHLELFYFRYSNYVNDGSEVKLQLYYGQKEDIIPKKTAMDNKIQEILSTVSDDMNDYEKEKAIHDYLVSHISYDLQNYLNHTIPIESFHPYGILVNGTGVCQGYAETFKVLMHFLDIDCIIVSGEGNEEGHAWNMVRLGDSWYQVDCTWDDPAPDRPGSINYTYFNVTDAVMSKKHKWVRSDYPQCNDVIYSYKLYEYCKAHGYSLDSCRTLSGKVYLPDGEPARSDSVTINLLADTGDYSSPPVSFTIDAGMRFASFSIPVPYNMNGYILYYIINEEKPDGLLKKGYYTTEGTKLNDASLLDITQGHVSDIHFPLLSAVPLDINLRMPENNLPKEHMLYYLNITSIDNSFTERILGNYLAGTNLNHFRVNVPIGLQLQIYYEFPFAYLGKLEYKATGYYSINGMTSNRDEATWLIFQKNGPAELNLTVIDPSDATLSEIKINGNQIIGFQKPVTNYTVEIPEFSAQLPNITAVPTCANAHVTISLPDNLPGTAVIAVTSEDGTQTGTYSIQFNTIPGYVDIDGDGFVNVNDAIAVLQHVVGLSPLSEGQINLADVNEDGLITSLDASFILKNIAQGS